MCSTGLMMQSIIAFKFLTTLLSVDVLLQNAALLEADWGLLVHHIHDTNEQNDKKDYRSLNLCNFSSVEYNLQFFIE